MIELIKKLSPATPIIAITGWGHHPKALASEAKADLVLDKPFEMQELDKALEKLLSENYAKRQKAETVQKPKER